MATNFIQRGQYLALVASSPTTPASGGVCRVGNMVGIAQQAEGTGTELSTQTVIDFGPAVYDLSVTDTGGGIAVGDKLYAHDGNPVTVNDEPSGGYFLGYALEVITAGQTDTINVLVNGASAG